MNDGRAGFAGLGVAALKVGRTGMGRALGGQGGRRWAVGGGRWAVDERVLCFDVGLCPCFAVAASCSTRSSVQGKGSVSVGKK
jgi:hypothetical protein